MYSQLTKGLRRVGEERNRKLVEEKMNALTIAEEEFTIKLDERLHEIEKTIEKQNEILSRLYSGLGNISSAM